MPRTQNGLPANPPLHPTIEWPAEFLAEYTDGVRERLLRGDGVLLTPPADDPEGHGSLSAEIPAKHPRNQMHGSRRIHFNELKGIYTSEGRRLWPTS